MLKNPQSELSDDG